MRQDYDDIVRRIGDKPLWFDENGCPRFDPFKPDLVADAHADEAALMVIACDLCGHEFEVAVSCGPILRSDRAGELFINELLGQNDDHQTQIKDIKEAYLRALKRTSGNLLAEDIRTGDIHYGDPPNVFCCAGGAATSSEAKRVLEYWSRDKNKSSPTYLQWVRDPSLEIEIKLR